VALPHVPWVMELKAKEAAKSEGAWEMSCNIYKRVYLEYFYFLMNSLLNTVPLCRGCWDLNLHLLVPLEPHPHHNAISNPSIHIITQVEMTILDLTSSSTIATTLSL
jgi:hypothetical protein